MMSWAIILNPQSLYMPLFPLKESEGKNDVLYCVIKFGKREGERKEGGKISIYFKYAFHSEWDETHDVG